MANQKRDSAPPLKILYLSQYFYPEQFLNNHIAKSLAGAGHQIDVITSVPNYPSGRFFNGYSNTCRQEGPRHDINVHRAFTVPRGNSKIMLAANFITYPIAAIFKLMKLKDLHNADVSFVSMPSPIFQAFVGIFAKRLWGIPTIYWVQDIWPDSLVITLKLRNRLVLWVLNLVCGWIYRQADLVMVQSDGFHSKISEFGVNPERIITLPNSAPEFFKPMDLDAVPPRIRDLMPQDRKIIMFAGNIGESQDFDTIIDAAKLISAKSDLMIVVVGSGRDENRVKDRVIREGVTNRFLFLGRHPEDDMPAFFACADAMLVSLRDEKIFALTIPSKVQAYLACGKPILAALAGEGASIIESSHTGLVVPPSSPTELCRAMENIAGLGQEHLNDVGVRARTTYEELFSFDSVTNNLLKHMRAVVREGEAGD